jgi:hypothetical protein
MYMADRAIKNWKEPHVTFEAGGGRTRAGRLTAGTVGLALAFSGGVFMPAVALADPAESMSFDVAGDHTYTVPEGVCGVEWTVVGGFGGALPDDEPGPAPGKVVVTTRTAPADVFDVVVGAAGAVDPDLGTASSVATAGDESAAFVIARGGGTPADNYVALDSVYGAPAIDEPETADLAGSIVTADPIDCVVLGPTALAATSPAPGSATLSWTPGEGIGLDATSWEVSTDGADGPWEPLTGVTADAQGRSVTLSELDGEYGFAVRAVNGGAYSAASNVEPLTVAAADQTVDVASTVLQTAGSSVAGQIDLTFTTDEDGTAPVTFEVTTDGGDNWSPITAEQDLNTHVWSASIAPLTPNHVYSVGVRGLVDEVAGPASDFQEITVAAPVAATPVLGSVTSPRAGEVELTFTVGTGETPDGYEASIDGGTTWSPLDNGGPADSDERSGTITSLTPGDVLSVGVRGVLDDVAGSPSEFKQVTVTSPVAATPVLDTVSSPRIGEVDLTFTDGAGAKPASYEVSTDDGVTWNALTGAVEDATTHTWSATLHQLTPGQELSVAVRGVVGGVNGPASQSKSVVVTAPAPVAATPVLGEVTSTRVGEVDLSFTDGAGAKPNGYAVTTDGGATWAALDTGGLGGGVWSSTLTALTPGTTYSVAVRGVLDGVPGMPSQVKQVTVSKPVTTVPDGGGDTPDPTVPHKPTGVSAVTDSSQVVVSWGAPTGGGAVDHYVVTLLPSGQSKSTKDLTVRFGAEQGKAYTATVVAVSADGVAGPGASATTPEVAAPEVPVSVPDAPLTLTTDKGQISKLAPGDKIVVIGDGFLPFSTATVIIYSEPQVLGSIVTDATGSFRLEVQVPAGLESGQHSLVASGVGADGTERFMRMNVTVDAAGVASVTTPEGGLAYTGFSPVLPTALGLGAVLIGGVTLLVLRRRRVAQD